MRKTHPKLNTTATAKWRSEKLSNWLTLTTMFHLTGKDNPSIRKNFEYVARGVRPKLKLKRYYSKF